MMVWGRRRFIAATVCSLLTITLSLLMSPTVFAEGELLPNCASGSVVWNNLDSTFKVILNCENLVSFSDDITSLTSIGLGDINISKIKLSTITEGSYLLKELSPSSADIISGGLQLTFNSDDYYFNGSLSTRNILIEPGILFNTPLETNDVIQIESVGIADATSPHAANDSYIMADVGLNVLAFDGVLSNDQEAVGTIANVLIVDSPTHGIIDMNNDGSFIYTPQSGYYGDDSFTYIISDVLGNYSEKAAVNILDSKADIANIIFVNQSASSESGYAKLGDTIKLSFETSEPVTINDIKIGGHTIVDYQMLSDMSYSASYVMQDTDAEGMIVYSISVIDRAGNQTDETIEDGIIFDMTKPTIYPDDSLPSCTDNNLVVCLEINDIYAEPDMITATDETMSGNPEDIEVIFSGTTDTGTAGVYIITYSATDRAGNKELFVRTIRVVDSVNDEYTSISNDLILYGITNNLSLITTNNFESFSGLFFEKSVDGKKIVRVTFLGPIDISNSELGTLVSVIISRFDSAKIGLVNLNLNEMPESDLAVFTAGGVIVQMFNLNALGYSNGTKYGEIIDRLSVFDEQNVIIDKSINILPPGIYIGCDQKIADCYTLKVNVAELFKYSIGIDIILPKITINNIKPINIGEQIVVSGTIDDSDSKLTLKFMGKTYLVPSENIINGRWSYVLNTSALGSGNYNIEINASDFANNQRTVSASFKIKDAIKPEAVIDNILSPPVYDSLSQTATINGQVDQAVSSIHTIIDTNQEVAAATSIKDSGIFGLSWLRLLIISIILSLFGLVALFIVKRRMR